MFSRWVGAARTATGVITKWPICFLAGLSTPLVLSVHSVVSFDFATSILPTWHTTIFPPYFVAGAIFGGFAMVLTLMIASARVIQTAGHHHAAAHRQDGEDHFADRLDRLLRLRDGIFHRLMQRQSRTSGSPSGTASSVRYWWCWWVGMLFCNVLSPQLFWFRWCRRNVYVVYFVCMCVNAGMWFERFIIIVGGLHRDFLPSLVGTVHPDLGGHLDLHRHARNFHSRSSFSLFASCPMIAMSEVKIVLPEADAHRARPSSGRNPSGERNTHDENALRSQGLRHRGGISECLGALRSG